MSKKSLYVAVHHEILTDVMRNCVLAPPHVMACNESRYWIPLHEDPSAAFVRARWGAEEIAKPVQNPKHDLMLLRTELSAIGFGHYCATEVLRPSGGDAGSMSGEQRWREVDNH